MPVRRWSFAYPNTAELYRLGIVPNANPNNAAGETAATQQVGRDINALISVETRLLVASDGSWEVRSSRLVLVKFVCGSSNRETTTSHCVVKLPRKSEYTQVLVKISIALIQNFSSVPRFTHRLKCLYILGSCKSVFLLGLDGQ